MYRLVLVACAVAWVAGSALIGNAAAALPSDGVREQLRNRIEAAGPPLRVVCRQGLLCQSKVLRQFYERRSFQPAWASDAGSWPKVDAFVQALRQADKEGLRPDDYHLSSIEPLLAEIREQQGRQGPIGPEMLADLDLLLTDAFLIYASHLLAGRVNPETINAEWYVQGKDADPAEILEGTSDEQATQEALRGLAPAHPGYARLRKALARYRAIAREGGWPSVPTGPKMRKGDQGRRVTLLRTRLGVTGDLLASQGGGGDPPSGLFDDALDRAVRGFQARHGLDADGVVGPATLAALNVPVEERIDQITVNMERWRWLPHDLGRRYVLVNIANFGLEVMEDDRPQLSMRVVIGKRYQATPVFSAQMTYLVLNPYWNVPPSIATREMLPLIRRDRAYLAKHRLKVFLGWGPARREIAPETVNWSKVTAEGFPYNLRQEAGPSNSLGRVKFIFPNRFHVYLHDTPERRLFARRVREFSHGCIRIEKPIDLAEYVLRGTSRWTREGILAAIDGGTQEVVRLPQPIAVHVLYWTAWANDDGSVEFRNDVYERDGPLKQALNEGPPPPEEGS